MNMTGLSHNVTIVSTPALYQPITNREPISKEPHACSDG